MVLATTNCVEAVDPAFRRPGRFDRRSVFGPPTVAGRREILSDPHARDAAVRLTALSHLDLIARKTHGFLGADLMELCREAGLSAMRRNMVSLADHRSAFRISANRNPRHRGRFRSALTRVRPSALRHSFLAPADVAWTQIGGLDAHKKRLQGVMEDAARPQFLDEPA